MDHETKEQIKRDAKQVVSLKEEYEVWDVLEALVLNDTAKLQQMRARTQQLHSAYQHFCDEMDSGNELRQNAAMQAFKRPQ